MPILNDVTASSIHADDPKGQIEAVVKQVNDGFRAISNEARTSIVKDDAGQQRLLTGYQQGGFSNGDVGVKLSQTGVDVGQATDDQLIFSTDFNLFKIAQSGTVSYTPPSSLAGATPQLVATIPHNLGVSPAFMVYVTNPNLSGVGYTSPGLTNLPSTVYITNSGSIILVSTADVDTTNLYIRFTYLAGGAGSITGLEAFTWNYKYYILRETAA